MVFKKGQPKIVGRKKGSLNKFTTLKQMYIDVCHLRGDTVGLKKFAQQYPKEFYRQLSSMLPKTDETTHRFPDFNEVLDKVKSIVEKK